MNPARGGAAPIRAVLVALLVVGALGYVGGRTHALGALFAALRPEEPAPASGPSRFVLPESIEPGASFTSLNAHLDSLLRTALANAGNWAEAAATLRGPALAAFQAGRRSEIRGMLAPWPPGGSPPLATVTPWTEEAGVTVSVVQLEALPGTTLLALLLQPAATTEPRPGLLVLHGTNATYHSLLENVDYHHGFAMALAREGFVVLAPLTAGSRPPDAGTLHVKAHTLGLHWEAIESWQLSRATDYLASLPSVDPRRLGIYGISMGGRRALRLAALDERFSMAVISGEVTNRFARIFQTEDTTGGIDASLPFQATATVLPAAGPLLDDMNLIALIAPRRLTLTMGEQDPRYRGAVAIFDRVRALYSGLGYEGRAQFIDHPGGHETVVDRVLPILREWRGPDAP